jgi:anti-sigma-K factor RskA
MSADAHVFELLPAYALDCLDEDDKIRVSEHLAACPVCQAKLRAYQDVADSLTLALPDDVPSMEVKHQLMDLTRAPAPTKLSPPQAAQRQSLANFMWPKRFVWGLIGLVLLLVFLLSGLWLWQQGSQEEAPQPEIMRTVPLRGTEVAPAASGLIIVSLNGQHGTLVVDRLPIIEAEQQYQLWLVRDGQRDSGAVFSVNEDGYGSVWVSSPEALSSYSSFEVTVEPTGGSPSLTGAKVLSGNLN